MTYRPHPQALLKLGLAATLILAGRSSGSAQEPVAEAKPLWTRSAAVGLTLTRGNSKNVLFTGSVLATRKTEDSELGLGADATYGETYNRSLGENEKNAESLRGFAQYNRLFSERFFGYARVEALHDAIADVDYRLTISPGAGYYFIRTPRTTLSGEVGPGFIYEKQGGDTTGYLTLRVAERFEHKFSERARIWQTAELLPQVDDFENYLLNAEIGVEASLTEKLSLRSYLQNTYDNQPAPGRVKNDLKLVTALAYKF